MSFLQMDSYAQKDFIETEIPATRRQKHLVGMSGL